MSYTAIPFTPEPELQEVDGLPVRFKLDRSNGTERAEAFHDGAWRVLWSARKTTKGGKQAWLLRQRDLKKAVWKVVHGHAPVTCSKCGLIVEDVPPMLLSARSCRECNGTSINH